MNRQEVIERLLDHYRSPRHRGKIQDADVIRSGGHPGCGDVITIYLKIDPETQKVTALSFEGEGCTVSQAAASILTEQMQQAELAEIEALDDQQMLDILGREVVQARVTCATLALTTLQRAIYKYRQDASRPNE